MVVEKAGVKILPVIIKNCLKASGKPQNLKGINFAELRLADNYINKKNYIESFFKDVLEEFEPWSTGIIKAKKRIIYGQQPISKKLAHDITDTRLSQPIQISEKSNYIYAKNGYENLNPNFVKQYLYKDEFNQVRQRNNLYLDIIQVKPEYQRQGVASRLMDELIKMSKEKYNGKFTLSALPPGGTEGQIPSPSLAYWSKGFRFTSEPSNIQMLKVKNGELPLTDAPCGIMFLDNLLAKF
jgi:GNAT superfamily N-acetyltransferase